MKICILSEKPSVAREIAAIVGAVQKEDGFLHGNGYMVTWALGHLVQLAMPEDYGFQGFVRENLPIIPETFILKPRQIRDGKCLNRDLLDYKIIKIKRNHVNPLILIIKAQTFLLPLRQNLYYAVRRFNKTNYQVCHASTQYIRKRFSGSYISTGLGY
jgi:hypothetical protein